MMLTCVTAVWNAIAAGNREKIVRCARSVAALGTPHEHLFMDGASTDGTLELLRELEGEIPGLKVQSSKDTGIYNALNKGVRDARGEWLYVLGCDDFICAPAEMDKVLADAGKADEVLVSPVETDGTDAPFDPGRDLWKVLWCTPYCHQGVLMRTDLVRRFKGFDERFRIAADYDLMLRLHLAARSVRYTSRAFAHFSVGGSCGQQVETMAEDFRRISAERLGLAEAEAVAYRWTGILPLRRSIAYLFHGDRAVRQGARRMLKRALARLVGLRPKPLDI